MLEIIPRQDSSFLLTTEKRKTFKTLLTVNNIKCVFKVEKEKLMWKS